MAKQKGTYTPAKNRYDEVDETFSNAFKVTYRTFMIKPSRIFFNKRLFENKFKQTPEVCWILGLDSK